jgi:CMP-2-keto-3-deoxyoctulosonic acid synthetase
MTRKLSEEDRRAVDLLLDHGASHSGVTRVAHAVAQKRLTAAERVLKLLGQMPADEPSIDLVAATMEQVDRATAGQVGRATRRAHAASQPPVA